MNSHTHTHISCHIYTFIYIYIYMCVCVCVCVWWRERERVLKNSKTNRNTISLYLHTFFSFSTRIDPRSTSGECNNFPKNCSKRINKSQQNTMKMNPTMCEINGFLLFFYVCIMAPMCYNNIADKATNEML